jgi:hypothetical protein
MVIWFNVKKAREFLLKFGYVYTLRPKKRREGREPLFYGGFGKKAMAWIIFIKKIENDKELEEYVKESGFETVEEWRREAKDSRYLYKVVLEGQNAQKPSFHV